MNLKTTLIALSLLALTGCVRSEPTEVSLAAEADASAMPVYPTVEPDAPLPPTVPVEAYFQGGYSGKTIFKTETCVVYKLTPDRDAGGFVYVATGTCAVAN